MIFYNYFQRVKHLVPNKLSRVDTIDSTKFCSLRQLLITYYVFKNHIRILLGIYFSNIDDTNTVCTAYKKLVACKNTKNYTLLLYSYNIM